MQAPVHRLKLKDIRRLANWRCRHSHSGLAHYNCWLKENPEKERIAFVDIESTALKADLGFMICYAIKDAKTGKMYIDYLKASDLKTNKQEDYRILKSFIKTISKYDRIIGWYSSHFDIPFIRGRALISNLKFPFYGSLFHNDIIYISRNKLCFHSNRQENVAQQLLGRSNKTHFDINIWRKASRGDARAIKKIVEHNIIDVNELEQIYYKIKDFAKPSDTSI